MNNIIKKNGNFTVAVSIIMAETKIPALISMIKDVAFVDRLLHAKISDLNEYAYKRVDKRSNRTTISWRPYQQTSKSALDSDLFLVIFSHLPYYLVCFASILIKSLETWWSHEVR